MGIWFKVVRKCKLKNEAKTLSWLAYDTSFKPGTLNQRFKQWASRGIMIIHTLIEKGEIKSFLKLRREHGLENKDFYMYLQIRDYFNKKMKPDSPLELNRLIVTLCNAYRSTIKRVNSVLYQNMV